MNKASILLREGDRNQKLASILMKCIYFIERRGQQTKN